MKPTRAKIIAISALAALAAVAALAIAGQPGNGGGGSEPASAAVPVKPRVTTEVVHRTRHVKAKGGAPAGGAVIRATPASGSPSVHTTSAPTPVVMPAENPTVEPPKSDDDPGSAGPGQYGDDDSYEVEDHGDDSYESDDHEDHEDEHELEDD